MTQPQDPQDELNHGVVGEPLLEPPLSSVAPEPVMPPPETMAFEAVVEPMPMSSEAVPKPEQPEPATDVADRSGIDEDNESGGKVKAVALLAGAAALANKVRQTAPKKVQELRDKRAAGRFVVVVTEVDGGSVAVGPYRDAATATDGAQKVTGAGRPVRLMSEESFLASQHARTSAG